MRAPAYKVLFTGFVYASSALLAPISPARAVQHLVVSALGTANEAFKIGPWVGAEQFLQDGTFFSCLMVANYGAGRGAAFGINNNYKFWFGLSSQNWQFSRGVEYTVTYAIDQSSQVTLQATAPYPNMLMANFIDDRNAFAKLRSASVLTVQISGLNETIQVRLKAMDDALSALAGCVDKNLAKAPRRNIDGDFRFPRRKI